MHVVAMIVIHWLELKIRFRSKYRKSGLTAFFAVQFFCRCRLYKLSALRGAEWVGYVYTLYFFIKIFTALIQIQLFGVKSYEKTIATRKING